MFRPSVAKSVTSCDTLTSAGSCVVCIFEGTQRGQARSSGRNSINNVRGKLQSRGAQRAQLSLAAQSEHVKAPAFRARSARS